MKLAHEDNIDFPVGALWSKDGMLLAVYFGSYNNGKDWDCIYDFSQHRRLWGRGRSAPEKSRSLNDLLARHGGPGPAITGQTRWLRWWENIDMNQFYPDIND